ncbi:MAG TPA: hypothetical protein VGA51_00280 [Casimicrobiaceae bacterium]
MPITLRNIPRQGAARLVEHLTELLREKAVPSHMPAAMRLEALSHSEPHPVFYAPLDALAGGKLLDAATQLSWRYLLVQDDAAVAEAELSVGRRGAKRAGAKPLEFLGLTHGPFTAATIEALAAAEQLPQVAAADYELRLLKIPAVYLVALWLHGAKDDILIPMGDPPGGLKKNRPYTEAAVIKALRGVVEQTKRFQDAYDENRRKRGRKKRP